MDIDIIEYERGVDVPADRRVDPVTEQVIAGALDSIALEVGHKLARMSYSSIIRESEDFGVALLDVRGRQICECSISTPLQLGPIPGYFRGIQRLLRERGQCLEEGDVILHNSPYHGASHAPDIGVCVPIFYRGTVAGYSFVTAHHLDIGSMVPGSCGIVDAVDVYAEGIQLKALKAYERGVRNSGVWQLLRDNIRASDLVVGDLEAQVAATHVGVERYVELLDKYGRSTVETACDQLMNYSERMLRREIANLPDGHYEAEGFIDGVIDPDDLAARDLRIAVAVDIEGDGLTVDLRGTAPQIENHSINMPFVGTVDVAVYVTLRSILLDSATHEYVPQNSGLVRPIRIVAERGSLANPTFPCSTIARFCTGNIVADTLMHALAPICHERISAGIGNLKVISYSGRESGDYWVYMDINEGAYGGMLGKDGIDAVDTLYANTRNNPIEDIEAHYPLRVTRYELRSDAAGAGQWRGGVGTIREVQALERIQMNIEGEGNCHGPWGVLGGAAGKPGALEFVRADGSVEALPSKLQGKWADPGARIRTVSPCGGGFGNPTEREPAAVLADVRDGIVNLDDAESLYGVVIDPSAMTVDTEMTKIRRAGRLVEGPPVESAVGEQR